MLQSLGKVVPVKRRGRCLAARGVNLGKGSAGRVPLAHLVDSHSQRVQVGPFIYPSPFEQFRGHVAGHRAVRDIHFAGVIERHCGVEVNEADLAPLVEAYVFWLQVQIQDAAAVDVGEPVRDFC